MGEYVNSTQVRFDKAHVSCGIVEIHHLTKNAAQMAFAVANNLYNKANPRPAAFVLFSDIVDVDGSRGAALAAYIKKNLPKSGHLWESPKEVNPKTGNTIQLWIWHLNHEELRKWYQDELANRVTE